MSRWDRSARVCGQIDATLCEQYPNEPFDELQRIDRERQEGEQDVAAGNHAIPHDVGEAIALIISIHATIFRGERAIAGRFRRPGELALFGGGGRHERKGVNPTTIEPRMQALMNRMLCVGEWVAKREQFALHCAEFLEEFFMIHPFVDGNGRTGRLFLSAAARTWSPWEFQWDAPGVRRRTYVQALQYAHRHRPENEDELRDVSVRRPCGPLAKWMESVLIERGDGIEEAPDSR